VSRQPGRENTATRALRITTPLTEEVVRSFRVGQRLLLSGPAYSCRDAAHKRMVEMLTAGGSLPFDLNGAVIYYAGPTPARPGNPVGAMGPTTSSRMDMYVEPLLKLGLRGMIGKGERSAAVRELLVQYGAVYLAATGGAGALLAASISSAEVVAWPELGTEAVRRIQLADFPALVANDNLSGDIYRQA
jgi:fumarate hydratase subunit beta